MRGTAVTGWRILLDEVPGAVQSAKVLGLEELELQEQLEQLDQQEHQEQKGKPADMLQVLEQGEGETENEVQEDGKAV